MLNGTQAAKYLGISQPTLWRIVDRREIEHVRIGRRIVFTEKALDEYILKNTVKPIEPQGEDEDVEDMPESPVNL